METGEWQQAMSTVYEMPYFKGSNEHVPSLRESYPAQTFDSEMNAVFSQICAMDKEEENSAALEESFSRLCKELSFYLTIAPRPVIRSILIFAVQNRCTQDLIIELLRRVPAFFEIRVPQSHNPDKEELLVITFLRHLICQEFKNSRSKMEDIRYIVTEMTCSYFSGGNEVKPIFDATDLVRDLIIDLLDRTRDRENALLLLNILKIMLPFVDTEDERQNNKKYWSILWSMNSSADMVAPHHLLNALYDLQHRENILFRPVKDILTVYSCLYERLNGDKYQLSAFQKELYENLLKEKEDFEQKEREKADQEETERREREEAEMRARQEAERMEKERIERDETIRKEREETEQKAKEEARRKARERIEREDGKRKKRKGSVQKAKEEADQKTKDKEEVAQKMKEKAEEEAEQKTKDKAEQKNEGDVGQKIKNEEEVKQKGKEETEQWADNEEEVGQKEKEETEQKTTEETEQKDNEEAKEGDQEKVEEEKVEMDSNIQVAEEKTEGEDEKHWINHATEEAEQKAQKKTETEFARNSWRISDQHNNQNRRNGRFDGSNVNKFRRNSNYNDNRSSFGVHPNQGGSGPRRDRVFNNNYHHNNYGNNFHRNQQQYPSLLFLNGNASFAYPRPRSPLIISQPRRPQSADYKHNQRQMNNQGETDNLTLFDENNVQ